MHRPPCSRVGHNTLASLSTTHLRKESPGLSEWGVSLENGCDSPDLDDSEGLWKQPGLRGVAFGEVIFDNFVLILCFNMLEGTSAENSPQQNPASCPLPVHLRLNESHVRSSLGTGHNHTLFMVSSLNHKMAPLKLQGQMLPTDAWAVFPVNAKSLCTRTEQGPWRLFVSWIYSLFWYATQMAASWPSCGGCLQLSNYSYNVTVSCNTICVNANCVLVMHQKLEAKKPPSFNSVS